MRGGWQLGVFALAMATLGGCSQCSSREPVEEAAPMPIELHTMLPAPAPWTFERVSEDGTIALPIGCTAREPLVRAHVNAQTRYVAEAHALGTLVVGETNGNGEPAVLVTAGAMKLGVPEPSTREAEVPWWGADAPPRVARASGGAWVAAIDVASDAHASRVGLWRGDGVIDTLGEGERFEAADLVCGPDACALLTSRIGTVQPPGALVWIGRPDASATEWRRVEIPGESDGAAQPLGFAKPPPRPIVTLLEAGEVVFVRVDDDGPHELARLPAEHGALDVVSAEAGALALVHGNAVDEDGCAGAMPSTQSPAIRLEREGSAPVVVDVPSPPFAGALRRLTGATLASWIAPLGCNAPRRVVYAVLLDEAGKPRLPVIPIADATAYAVAAAGSDVDLWLYDGASAVTWLRLRCSSAATEHRP